MNHTEHNRDIPTDEFRKQLAQFDTAMLYTVDRFDRMHGRPMRVVARHQERLDDLWFVTALDSGKVEEIERDPRAAVAMIKGSSYMNLSGRARVVRDPEKIEAMWHESWKLWFPDGPSSEDIALIQLCADFGEYWDRTVTDGVRFAFDAATAWIRDEGLDDPEDYGEHLRLALGWI